MMPESPAPDPVRAAGYPERDRGDRPGPLGLNTGQVKACCAAAYDSDAVALLLGDVFHPGGQALTRRLAGYLGLEPGHRVLDVASGPGSTALLLAREHGVQVDGVDLGAKNLARASAAAEAAGLAGRVRFRPGDAERLPFPDQTFDAVVCECAFCTFPAKETAAAEFARVLRPVAGPASPTSPWFRAGWTAGCTGSRAGSPASPGQPRLHSWREDIRVAGKMEARGPDQ
jgi:SAM-dependent methyltransferase